MWHAFFVRHHIEQVMDAIAQVDVRGATGTVHRLGAFRSPIAISVTRLVGDACVSLGLGNDRLRQLAVDPCAKDFAQEITTDSDDIVPKIKVCG